MRAASLSEIQNSLCACVERSRASRLEPDDLLDPTVPVPLQLPRFLNHSEEVRSSRRKSQRNRLFQERNNDRTQQILKLQFIFVAANVEPHERDLS